MLTDLEPSLGRRYTAAVVRVAPAIERSLGPSVFANRVAGASLLPPVLALRDWRRERDSLRAALRALTTGHPILRTDVAACYQSIGPDAVEDGVGRCGAGRAAAARCARLVRELDREGVEGLPIGPAASAVLANAVLSTGDRALRLMGARFVRWVDDWWIEVGSGTEAAEVLARLGAALAPAALRLSDAKTRMCGPDPLAGRPSIAGYHRAAHADALPLLPGSDAVVPGDGRVAPG